MKKINTILLLLFCSFYLFAEIEISGGVGCSYDNRKLTTDDLNISTKSFDFNLNAQLKYFFSETSQYGFGVNILYSLPSTFYNCDYVYSGKESYHLIQEDTWWIQQNNTPAKYPYVSYENRIFLEPDFFYRYIINDSSRFNIGIGPSYSISFRKYMYANENNSASKKSGGINYNGYSEISLENILRQNFGVSGCIQYAFGTPVIKELGIKASADFFEVSKFTEQKLKPCTNYSISIFINWTGSIPTSKERKEINRQQEIERQKKIAYEQERIEKENEKLKTHYKIFNDWYEKELFPSYIQDIKILSIDNSNFMYNNPYGFDKSIAYLPDINGSVLQWLADGCLYDFAGSASSLIQWSCLSYIIIPENQRNNMFDNHFKKFYHYIGPYTYTTTRGSSNTVPAFEIIFYEE